MRINPVFVIVLPAVVLSMVSGVVSIGGADDPHCVQECHTTPTPTGEITECTRACRYQYTPGGGVDSSPKGGRGGKVRRALGFFSSTGVSMRPEQHRFRQCVLGCGGQLQSSQQCLRQCQSEVASGTGAVAGGGGNDAWMLDVQA